MDYSITAKELNLLFACVSAAVSFVVAFVLSFIFTRTARNESLSEKTGE